MQEYFSHIPVEIFEQVLHHLDGIDLGRLKQISKKFKNSLDNPTALRIIFNYRFPPEKRHVTYIDDFIDWSAEMNRIGKIQAYGKSARNQIQMTVVMTLSRPISNLKVYKNHFILDGFAPVDIASSVNKKSINLLEAYKEHMIIGSYAGRKNPDAHGFHNFIDVFAETDIPSYKKLIPVTKGTLIAFNKTFAVIASSYQQEMAVYNRSVQCKHTDEVLWKRSTKKKEFCDVCAYMCSLQYNPERHSSANVYCSQLSDLIFMSEAAGLEVVQPLLDTSFHVARDIKCQIECPKKISTPQSVVESACKFAGEQKMDVYGKRHHIVHCTVGSEHHFYDLTTKKLMAIVTDRRESDIWIPNTSYLATSDGGEVIVIDFKEKKIISRFDPKSYMNKLYNARKDEVVTMTASRSSPILFVLKVADYLQELHMCSALTAGPLLLTVRWTPRGGAYKGLNLSEDEKTLIAWTEHKADFWDIQDRLACLHKNYKKPK